MYTITELQFQELKNLRFVPKHIIEAIENKDEFYIHDVERSVPEILVWWKPNALGYTTDLTKAGKYTEEQIKQLNIDKDTKVFKCSDIDKISEKIVRRTVFLNTVELEAITIEE